jgi:hypothetical protein
MFADTDAVRAFGAAHSSHAADLSAIALTLSSLPIGAVATMMGPVAADFVAALAEAAAAESHAVSTLGDKALAAAHTARSSAAAYDAADQRAGASLPQV